MTPTDWAFIAIFGPPITLLNIFLLGFIIHGIRKRFLF